nr:MAG TPA: hypothetical protein [Caudoviricetes sp.]
MLLIRLYPIKSNFTTFLKIKKLLKTIFTLDKQFKIDYY